MKIQVLRETKFGDLPLLESKRNEILGIKRMALTRVADYQHGDAHRN